MNLQQVTNWFQTYKEMLARLEIENIPSHIWNIDEIGCQTTPTTGLVLGQVGVPSITITPGEKGETSTVAVAMNAVGQTPQPIIIHKGKKVGKNWRNGARHNTMVVASDTAYINKELFLMYSQQWLTTSKPHQT